MKNEKFLKLNILLFIFIFAFAFNAFAADTIYSPGASKAIAVGPHQTLSSPSANTTISAEAAAAISQIQVRDSSDNSAISFQSPDATFAQSQNQAVTPNIISQSATLTPSSFTTVTVTGEKTPSVAAPAYILINATTKHIYTSKDLNGKYEPAGLVNLMTAYIASKKLTMDSILTVKGSAIYGIDKDAAIAALNVGDTITLKDAIASMFVKGCVDSANVIAENVSGSVEEFVKLMNDTAIELGLTNSNFTNPSGLNNDSQVCSAFDLAIIMAHVCQNKELVDLLHLSTYVLPAAKKRDKLTLYNKNTQLAEGNSTYNADVAASRMGFTTKSKYCISSLMNYNNNQIIAVVLKAAGTQFSDTKKLLEYGKIGAAQEN